MTALTAFHHVSLSVRDLDASVAWYQRVLDLQVLFLEEGDERRAAVLGFSSGAFAVGLSEHRGNVTTFDPSHTGLDHFAFAIPTREDLTAWEDRLTAEGVDHSGAIDIPSGAILNFKDADGIALAFFWNRG